MADEIRPKNSGPTKEFKSFAAGRFTTRCTCCWKRGRRATRCCTARPPLGLSDAQF